MNEIEKAIEWRDVIGYEGLYQISNKGDVKRKDTGRILKKTLSNHGYYQLSLCKNGKQSTVRIHNLVASAFIPNPLKLPQVNHKDECKTNNVVDNLEWCTQKYNLEYKNGQKRRAKARNYEDISKMRSNKISKEIVQIDYDGTIIAIWKNAYIAEQHGYNQSAINQCCLGKNKTHNGYIWKYTNFIEKQLNGDWIPVKKRLPTAKEWQKNDCRFIVTDGNRVYQDIFDYIADGYIEPKWICSNCQPIAWQEMPEKYKEDNQ